MSVLPSEFLRISPRISALPVIHGSGDFAVEVRRQLLGAHFDCLAVPLPPSFQDDVERAIDFLPAVTAVVQEEPAEFDPDRFDREEVDGSSQQSGASYVPIDPCQPVIAALRFALQEQMPRAFIDAEIPRFQPQGAILPDPYALKRLSPAWFAAALLPAIPRPGAGSQQAFRCATMGVRLRELESRYRSILLVCSLMDWPWIREAYTQRLPVGPPPGAGERDPLDEFELPEPTSICAVDPATLVFFLGELPFLSAQYERARSTLDDDENLSIDGIKALLLAARDHDRRALARRDRSLTPKGMSLCLQYVRNLTLLDRRLTPDFFSLVIAAKQVFGDQFAVHVAETAREYLEAAEPPFGTMQMGVERARLPNGDVVRVKSRLPGRPVTWRKCELRPRPPQYEQQKWRVRWNPFRQCSWPPEDVAIERFRTHVKDTALALIGSDLARVEKFSTSLKDGLDIRETLRNWHKGELYVRVFPPSRGKLDCVIMLFDAPADPRDYPWRITWHAEHNDESTLAFFATDYLKEIVGPGIALATYGGAVFLFPPRPIPDVWRDRRFDFTDTLEERLIAAGCYHSRERHVAVVSAAPPGLGLRRLARKYRRKLVHVPLGGFNQQTIEQLRLFHVLNGRQIRSFAAHFIRKV